MRFIHKYLQYLRNNPERYWFKRKIYGWGWTPATSEGWLTLIAFTGVFAWILTMFLRMKNISNFELFLFLGTIFVWAMALVFVGYMTGEPPKWGWGFPEEDKKIDVDK